MADIRVTLGLDSDQYQRGLDRAGSRAQTFGREATRALGGIGGQFQRLGTDVDRFSQSLSSLGAQIAGVGLGAFTAQIMNLGDQVSDISAGLGVTTQSLLEMTAAAAPAGATMEDLSAAINRLTSASEDAISGNDAMVNTFRRLGITAADLARMSVDERFRAVARALESVENPAERAALRMDLFGRSARNLDISGFNQGLDASRGTMGSAAAAMESAGRAADDLNRILLNLKIAMAQTLRPMFDIISVLSNIVDSAAVTRTAAGLLSTALLAIAGSSLINGVRVMIGLFSSLGAGLAVSGVAAAASARNIGVDIPMAAERARLAFAFLTSATSALGSSYRAVAAAQSQLTNLQASGAATTEQLTAAQLRLDLATQKLTRDQAAFAAVQAQLNGVLAASTAAVTSAAGGQSAAASATAAATAARVAATSATTVNTTATAANTVAVTANTAAIQATAGAAGVAASAIGALTRGLNLLLQAALGFYTGFVIGDIIYDQFEIARVAGQRMFEYLARGFYQLRFQAAQAMEGMRVVFESQRAIFTDDTISGVLERSRARSAQILADYQRQTQAAQQIFDQQRAALARGESLRPPSFAQIALPETPKSQRAPGTRDRSTRSRSDRRPFEDELRERQALAEAQARAIMDELARASAAEQAALRIQDQTRTIQDQTTLTNQLLARAGERVALEGRLAQAQRGDREAALAQFDAETAALREQGAIQERIRQTQALAADATGSELEAYTALIDALRASGREIQSNATVIGQQRRDTVLLAESQRIRQELLNRELGTQRQVQQITAEMATQTMPTLAAVHARAAAAARDQAQAMIDAAAVAQQPMDQEQQRLVFETALAQARQLSDAQVQLIENSRTFATGWQQSLVQFTDAATNAAEQTRAGFQAVLGGINSAVDQFVETGRFSFRSFAAGVVKDLIKIYMQAQFTRMALAALGFFGGMFSGGGGGGGMPGSLTVPGPQGFTPRASGGPVSAGVSYLVGERGPEMFVPQTSGRIQPRPGLDQDQPAISQTVNYNIQAVDAVSFRDMLSRDPEFLHRVAERGRRSNPTVGGRR